MMKEWQPIETAPTDETVLVHWAESLGFDGSMGLGALFTDEEDDECPMWYAATEEGHSLCSPYPGPAPTHWMAMPEPPEAR